MPTPQRTPRGPDGADVTVLGGPLRSPRARRILAVGVALAYLVVLVPLRGIVGEEAVEFAVLPTLLFSLTWGLRAGIAAAAGLVAGAAAVLHLAGVGGWETLFRPGAWPDLLVLLTVAAAFGRLREVGRLLRRELVRRREAEAGLRAVHAGLEERVRERTVELDSTNQSLQREVGERERAESALRASEERYALAAQGANDGLWDWDLRADRVFFSQRWKGMLGYDPAEIGDRPHEWLGRIHPQDRERVWVEISAHLDGTLPHFESEHRVLHKDGGYRWMRVRGLVVRDAEGRERRMAGSQTDISVQKATEEQLIRRALYDPLTSLPNRALFMDRLGHALERFRRRPGAPPFGVFFLDLDRFKLVNDSLGHLVGDQLLIQVAGRLQSLLRPEDTVARLGGDEFAILLEAVSDAQDAMHVASRLQAQISAPVSLEGYEVATTASIGICMGAGKAELPEDVVRNADVAMYRAKTQGPGRAAIFDTEMHAQVMARLRLETDLGRAVDHDELVLHYQPVVALKSGKVDGFEALVRWNHPERGLVPPAQFIPVAEETGTILPIGAWVLREACAQLRAWQRRYPERTKNVSVNVNLSARQFTQGNLPDEVAAVLRETGLAAKHLKLEITESMLMEDPDFTRRALERLRGMGVQLCIDDFGTGYSSLSHLHALPIDTLKVDRAFVAKRRGDEGWEIVNTIIALAHTLNMDVIAEGVETQDQCAILRDLGCECGQGFLFAPALDAEAAAEVLGTELGRPDVDPLPLAQSSRS